MCKGCWISVLVLLLAIAGMAYKFVFSGSVVAASDGREAIVLTPAERDMVLAEMRTFLETVQAVTDGVVKDDMAAVAGAARRVGSAARQGMPGSLVGKLPLGFKQLGFDTHSRFEQLALDAEQLGDGEHTLGQLAELMQNCVACHATYRFTTDGVAQATP